MHIPLRAAPCAAVITALVSAGGCQTYEPAPLDLAGHREQLGRRAFELEPVQAFAARLHAAGAATPDRVDPADGLTPAEGEVLALFYNPELRLARLDADVASATFENAGLWEDPQFAFDAAELLSPSGPFQFGLTLGLTLPVSGRLNVEKDRAGAAYETELRRVVDAEWRVRTAVRQTWARWATAEMRSALLHDEIAQVQRIAEITDQLGATGELSRVEARLFRIELAERRAGLAHAELAAARLRLKLLGLLGLAADADVRLDPSFPVAELPAVDDAERRLVAANTELAIHRAAYHVAEESLRLEIRKQYPDITFGAGYGSEDNDDRLLLGISIPLPLFNANQAGIAEATAARAVARGRAETAYERLAGALAAARLDLEATREQRARHESEIVPLLSDQFEEVRRIAELGDVNTLLLLETVSRQSHAKERVLEHRLEELEATIALTHLLGPDGTDEPAPISGASDAPAATAEGTHP